jgi:DNA-binding NtrC family response regulator
MNRKPTALLLHSREEPLKQLGRALRNRKIATVRAKSYAEAVNLLGREDAPALVFTDLTTSDGLWGEALCLGRTSPVPVNVIVVSDVPDFALWGAATRCGAFGFLTVPLPENELHALVQHAVENVGRRRPAKLHRAKTA